MKPASRTDFSVEEVLSSSYSRAGRGQGHVWSSWCGGAADGVSSESTTV